MVIGIDARGATEERAGRGRVQRELIAALGERRDEHEYVLVCRRPGDPVPSRLRWLPLDGPDVVWHLKAARAANRLCDVYLSTGSYLTAWFTRTPTVLLIHDLVPFLPGARGRRRSVAIERATLPLALRRAAGLMSISESTARDLGARFPATAGRAVVAPLAADASFRPEPQPEDEAVRARHGIAGRYVLGVGTLEPRKNLVRLVEAFASLESPDWRLVIVGPLGWETGESWAALNRHPDRVLTVGHVPDEDLPAIYRGADLFAYPSLYEGFGLPVLEAMACGTAVLTSNVSSLPEVGGDAALYVTPTDTRSIAEGLRLAISDPDLRHRLGEEGARRAREFSWSRFAAITVATLERVAR